VLEHILVGLDGSPLAETTLGYVKMLAKGLDADVTLLHVLHLPESVSRKDLDLAVDEAVKKALPQAQAYLERTQEALQAASIRSKVAVVTGDAAAEIVNYAETEGNDLIALATHGRSGLEQLLHGSVADRVTHLTTVPLLLVNPTTEWVAAPPEIKQVLVPLDGSPLAEAVLPLAEKFATSFNVPIVLLRIVEMLNFDMYGPESGADPMGYERTLQLLREAAEGYLEQVANRLRQGGLKVEARAVLGFPAPAIAAYAHDHPGSLLVLGTHGRGGIVGFFLGSVARRVVQQADAPIIVVRPVSAPEAV
jgi:nucleotide-binding universal stress UspA family protein